MKKTIVALFLICLASIVYSAEKISTNTPIIGGFGVRLGDKLTPNLEKSLNAKKCEEIIDLFGNRANVVYYEITPPKPLKDFSLYRIAITNNRVIYRIEAIYNNDKKPFVYNNVVFSYGKKYGLPLMENRKSIIDNGGKILYVERKNKNRMILIEFELYNASIIYQDCEIGAETEPDI